MFASESHLAPWQNIKYTALLLNLALPFHYLHVQTMDVDALLGRVGEGVPAGDVGHVRDEAHLVQGQLLLPRRALHYRRQEALRVEESRQPDRGGQDKLVCPGLKKFGKILRLSSILYTCSSMILSSRSAYHAERPLRDA